MKIKEYDEMYSYLTRRNDEKASQKQLENMQYSQIVEVCSRL